jgi:hypothetical protein
MATTTTNLGLTKPATTELYDIEIANTNMDLIDNIISKIYSIGSIYISTLSTNPNTLFGFGTWIAFGAGRTLVGIDGTQTEFDSVEETGGAKTHVLTNAQMGYNNYGIVGGSGANIGVHDHNITATAHNNLQPYIVVYMWKRTA